MREQFVRRTVSCASAGAVWVITDLGSMRGGFPASAHKGDCSFAVLDLAGNAEFNAQRRWYDENLVPLRCNRGLGRLELSPGRVDKLRFGVGRGIGFECFLQPGD